MSKPRLEILIVDDSDLHVSKKKNPTWLQKPCAAHVRMVLIGPRCHEVKFSLTFCHFVAKCLYVQAPCHFKCSLIVLPYTHSSPPQYFVLLLCIFLLEILAGVLAYIYYQQVNPRMSVT